jgi:hypothetical protein
VVQKGDAGAEVVFDIVGAVDSEVDGLGKGRTC